MNNLSEEEKKAIERLNKRYDFFKENPLATNVWLTLDIHNLGILLNLIEKQSKEIERLETRKYMYNAVTEEISQIPVDNNYISKDKIKAKIEEIENTGIDVAWEQVNYINRERDRAKIEVLQSLLEEE